ncbi:MAG: 4Fe-4S dicluster domain-containing protein [Planctomycetota bacterium]
MGGKIIIDTELCKSCGLCVVVCPKNSIVISKGSNKNGYFPAEKNNDDCTGCAMCAVICPEAIIEVQCDDSNRIKIAAVGRGKQNKSSLTKEKV